MHRAHGWHRAPGHRRGIQGIGIGALGVRTIGTWCHVWVQGWVGVSGARHRALGCGGAWGVGVSGHVGIGGAVVYWCRHRLVREDRLHTLAEVHRLVHRTAPKGTLRMK